MPGWIFTNQLKLLVLSHLLLLYFKVRVTLKGMAFIVRFKSSFKSILVDDARDVKKIECGHDGMSW
ncbi:MAG: hypothetical protein ACTSWN_14770 [Promethearchaeota archaeon]